VDVGCCSSGGRAGCSRRALRSTGSSDGTVLWAATTCCGLSDWCFMRFACCCCKGAQQHWLSSHCMRGMVTW
jgi:hypothetical protein